MNCERCWTESQRLTPARVRVKAEDRVLCVSCAELEEYSTAELDNLAPPAPPKPPPVYIPAAKPKEEKTMAKEEEARVCSVVGCRTKLGSKNRTGRCSKHFYVKKADRAGGGRTPVPLEKKARGRPRKNGTMVEVSVALARIERWWADLADEGRAKIANNLFGGLDPQRKAELFMEALEAR